jgi:hypothetical protein
VSRDASLDEFVEGSESDVREASEVDSEGEEPAVKQDDGGDGSKEVSKGGSSVEATYMWTPAGDACARCEGSAGRLWRCDGELVCGECKEW